MEKEKAMNRYYHLVASEGKSLALVKGDVDAEEKSILHIYYRKLFFNVFSY